METKAATKVNKGHANLIPCKPGETHNPNGRPKGALNYSTIRRNAFEAIGKSKGMTAEQVELLMVQSGLGKAIQGDFRFYQDDMNRAHGKPAQPLIGDPENPINHVHKVIWE